MSDDLILSPAEAAALKYRLLVEMLKKHPCECTVCTWLAIYEAE